MRRIALPEESASARGARRDLCPATTTRPRFEEIYASHFSYVFHTLRRLGMRPCEADDLLQEVFLVVYRRLPDFEADRPMKPWLFGIVLRVVSEHRRRRAPARPAQVDALELADDAPSAETRLASRQARSLVLEALEALDLEQRAVLVMHDIDEQPTAAVADAIGIPVNTVYSRLRAARQKFASRVRQLRLVRGEA
jgi:RNA polymerase sigma-70 factor (ECF subfamily)